MKITWPQIPENFAEESVNALTEAETKLSGLIEKEQKRISFSRWDKKHPKRIEEYQDFRPTLSSTLDLIKKVYRIWEIHDVIEENKMNSRTLKVETCIGKSGMGMITFKKKGYTKKSKDMKCTWPGVYETIYLDRDFFYKVVKDDHIDFSEIGKAFLDSASEVKKQIAILNGPTFNQVKLSDLSPEASGQLIEANVIYL